MVNVVVTSAIQLSSTQLEHIKKAIVKKYGKDLTITAVVDPQVIAGLKITIGSRQLDGSVQGKLQQLKQSMQQSR